MTVLIIAASKSDVELLRKAVDVLYSNKAEYDFRVCSAHRTPEMLDRILSEKEYDVIITGAGLAAALPGVVAAKTTAPVIGVPLTGAFEGLDALLSIIQMPPGIPVLTTGVNNSEQAGKAALAILSSKADKVTLITKGKGQKAMNKAAEILKAFEITYETGKGSTEGITICFIDLNERKLPETKGLTIYVPTTEKEAASDAAKLLQLTKSGIWVGLNRGDNAAVAAAEIMKRKKELGDYRAVMRQKVEEADNEVYGKL